MGWLWWKSWLEFRLIAGFRWKEWDGDAEVAPVPGRGESLCSWIPKSGLRFWEGVNDLNGAERDRDNAGASDCVGADRSEMFDRLLQSLMILESFFTGGKFHIQSNPAFKAPLTRFGGQTEQYYRGFRTTEDGQAAGSATYCSWNLRTGGEDIDADIDGVQMRMEKVEF